MALTNQLGIGYTYAVVFDPTTMDSDAAWFGRDRTRMVTACLSIPVMAAAYNSTS